MEENNTMMELDQMREQMQVLRNKLDTQEIVNEKLVKNSVKSKMSWIKKLVYFEFLLIPFTALMGYVLKEMFNLSWFTYAFIVVLCVIDAVCDYRINVAALDLEKVEKHNLSDTLQKLVAMKKMRAKSFFIMMLLSIPLFIWASIEMWQNISTITFLDDVPANIVRAEAYAGLVGGIIGFFVGIYISIRIYRKMQTTNDEIIAQLEEFYK
ncbi:MAG: hypothetical protein IKF42_11035 [Mogibacterium sp.]|nr:hypothetical protein [Mogibacterium sp.]